MRCVERGATRARAHTAGRKHGASANTPRRCGAPKDPTCNRPEEWLTARERTSPRIAVTHTHTANPRRLCLRLLAIHYLFSMCARCGQAYMCCVCVCDVCALLACAFFHSFALRTTRASASRTGRCQLRLLLCRTENSRSRSPNEWVLLRAGIL